jgi:hypothetical protein
VNERGPNAPVREKERLAGEKKKEKGEPGGKGAAHTGIQEKRGPPTHACEREGPLCTYEKGEQPGGRRKKKT